MDRDEFVLVALGGAVVFGLGVAVGAQRERKRAEDAQLSRAERDDPELVAEVLELVEGLFTRLRYKGKGHDHEDGYRDALAGYLKKKLPEFQIEIAPNTTVGYPDILVNAACALDVKRELTRKSEVDRAIGQCLEYATEWPTAMVLFDTPISRVKYVCQRLDEFDLGVELWDFGIIRNG